MDRDLSTRELFLWVFLPFVAGFLLPLVVALIVWCVTGRVL